MNRLQERKPEHKQIRFSPIQEKTLELCPKCGGFCSLVAADYRNIRCWEVKCKSCDYFSYVSTERPQEQSN